MRAELEQGAKASELLEDRGVPQERVLTEAVLRIRRFANMSESEKHNRPLIIVVTKQDVWAPLLGTDDDSPPWKMRGRLASLDVPAIEQRSVRIRKLLHRVAPTIVNEAERFWDKITFIGVSALGTRPVRDPATNMRSIRPGDIRPSNVTLPLLHGITQSLPGLIASVRSNL